LGRTLLSYLATSLIGAVAGKVLIRFGEAVLGRSTPMQALLLAGALSLILVVHIGAALLLKTPDGEEIRRIGARVMGKVRRA
jgi:ABC-type siderophore export system fused ATPase/permease subunit